MDKENLSGNRQRAEEMMAVIILALFGLLFFGIGLVCFVLAIGGSNKLDL